jgi:hypothetical protein
MRTPDQCIYKLNQIISGCIENDVNYNQIFDSYIFGNVYDNRSDVGFILDIKFAFQSECKINSSNSIQTLCSFPETEYQYNYFYIRKDMVKKVHPFSNKIIRENLIIDGPWWEHIDQYLIPELEKRLKDFSELKIKKNLQDDKQKEERDIFNVTKWKCLHKLKTFA